MKKIAFITLLILFIDQVTKIYVKTHFTLGESIEVFGLKWWRFTFVENPGMAYGVHFGGLLGKYLLVIIRVVVIAVMLVYFRKWLREGASNYFIVPMAMIFAGAVGNLIDGMFYGMIFNSGTTFSESINHWISYDGVSRLVPLGQGYSSFMKGCVVDMFHFPLFNFDFAGRHFEFFSYIFNVADSSITIGFLFLILFKNKAFPNGFDF
ncbi:lipoprotein signal peptidase [Riemerella columbipharyngis]|uniref:Lipoprotein signal peptidase n=1 Tax=Riemerella columbipharyngis TaxID=1071918 RepID=A0A1G7AUX0_9FLAO|nr:lipoprotein signal peptidase [Riemerella columbipharyngis]SDE18522.1 signal peptidase II [Riemerella columbipharyngis]